MSINYTHAQNLHTLDAPRAVLPMLFAGGLPTSLLDVGCGIGTWLKAALELGIEDIMGIDGIDVTQKGLLVPKENFRCYDLTQSWDLGRRFDAALCLEVAEHLPETVAKQLIFDLTRHADLIAFSAACPGQSGDHHINCQWPDYWQGIFNSHGFRCDDLIRWNVWSNDSIEPWYRQNLFVAFRAGSGREGEPRMKSVVHPSLWMSSVSVTFSERLKEIENGRMPLTWYLKTPVQAAFAKLRRKLRRKNGRSTSP